MKFGKLSKKAKDKLLRAAIDSVTVMVTDDVWRVLTVERKRKPGRRRARTKGGRA